MNKTCPPPQPPPGLDLSPMAKLLRCMEDNEDFYNFIKGIVNEVLEEEGLIPPGFEWPPLGVRDGTLSAAPGDIGELVTAQFNGNFTGVSTGGAAFVGQFPIVLSAGCWDIGYLLQIFGGQVPSGACMLDPNPSLGAPTTIPGNLMGFNIATASQFIGPAAMTALPIYCPPQPYSSAAAIPLAFKVLAWAGSLGPFNPLYQFNLTARRVR